MTDLRDVIARAIYASDFDIPAGELEEQWAWSAARSSYQNNADTVLAVLADLPDDVIEQATRGIVLEWLRTIGSSATFDEVSPGQIGLASREARAAFEAVFGGEQS